MPRGEIWTLAGGGDFMGGPRPVVILQDDRFDDLDSITVCPLTTTLDEAPLYRVRLQPTALNGLDRTSQIMADKISTARKLRLGRRIGLLDDEEMSRLGSAVLVFLGLA